MPTQVATLSHYPIGPVCESGQFVKAARKVKPLWRSSYAGLAQAFPSVSTCCHNKCPLSAENHLLAGMGCGGANQINFQKKEKSDK